VTALNQPYRFGPVSPQSYYYVFSCFRVPVVSRVRESQGPKIQSEFSIIYYLQVNVFLSRLCGEPIGFTVVGIFVIDKNTILTVRTQLHYTRRSLAVTKFMFHNYFDNRPSQTDIGPGIHCVMNRRRAVKTTEIGKCLFTLRLKCLVTFSFFVKTYFHTINVVVVGGFSAIRHFL